MKTECNTKQLEFHALERREVIGKFDGGAISSDGGCILLREVEKRTGILKRLAECFTDERHPELIEHSVDALIKQRVYGIALGYEDLNDHDQLRHDPLLAVLCDKSDPLGNDRRKEQDKGKALAGKSTLNRLELSQQGQAKADRYKRIGGDTQAMDALMLDIFIESFSDTPKQLVIDMDTTDDPLHGQQEGRFFHGYYNEYCYLPLYILCGDHLLCARLRTADTEDIEGTINEVERIVNQLRQHWPEVDIILRADSGFCREPLMHWCEGQDKEVKYVFGLAKNTRLNTMIEQQMSEAKLMYEETGKAARCYNDFTYQTLTSWTVARRVVGKAEYIGKENPRYIVTNLSPKDYESQKLYEELYCARGDMENRIKEQQLCLFADRTSTSLMHSNQLRLYFSSFAYLIMSALRRLGLSNTELEKAQCSTIRSKLLKIGTHINITVRKVWLSFSQSYPYHTVFTSVLRKLQLLPLRI